MKPRRHTNPSAEGPSSGPPEPVGAANQDLISLLQTLRDGQSRMEQTFQDQSGQNAFLRQQVGQLYDAVRQLWDAVRGQCVQLHDSDLAVQEELRKFQTGGPQRAMAGVFHKLFRDLLRHMNQLDDLVRLTEQGEHGEAEKPWMEATRVLRDNLESLLRDWGCTPVAIQAGQDEFNPEVHEAAPDDGHASVSSADGNRIVKVVRRGWQLSGTLIQHPRVIVN